MYEPLPNFYTRVVQNQVRHVFWSGTITADGVVYSFGAKNIVANSGKITNEICGSKMEIGTAYSSELDIGIYIDDIGVPRDKIYGAKIAINCVLRANGMQSPCPMGVFNVVEATQKGEVCTIVAYDNMVLLDIDYPISSGRLTAYGWLEMWSEACGFTLGQTEQEVRSLPNGRYAFNLDWTEEGGTYRELLAQLAAAVGCSAHFNRNGQLELVPLRDFTSAATLRANDRFGSDIAHTQWSPSAFYVRNAVTGAISYAGSGQLAFDLGENAFLQTQGYMYIPALEQPRRFFTVTEMLENILRASSSLEVVPIDAEIPLDPCLDLFDIITLTGGQANNTKVLITSLTHTIGGGTTIKCAGDNTTEESKTTSASNGGSSKDAVVWVDGIANDKAISVPTGQERWGEQRAKLWGDVILSNWGDLFNGGGWVPLTKHDKEEGFQRFFTGEFTLGVIGLTVNYECEFDTDVRFFVQISKWIKSSDYVEGYYYDGAFYFDSEHLIPIIPDMQKIYIDKLTRIRYRYDGTAYRKISAPTDNWVSAVEWAGSEHALKGKHTTSLVVPFGILDRDDTAYRFSAYIAGVDVVVEQRYLTREEILALV